MNRLCINLVKLSISSKLISLLSISSMTSHLYLQKLDSLNFYCKTNGAIFNHNHV